MTTYTIEEATWAGAEIFAWDDDGFGDLIGEAHFVSEIGSEPRVVATLHAPRTSSPPLDSPAAVLAWVEETLKPTAPPADR